jgi:signal transduction histidine kinase
VLLNAVIYSRPDGGVLVRVGRDGTDAVVDVVDSCGGIDDGDLAHVFETGWQKDRSRGAGKPVEGGAPRYSGAGVGLSMVAGIVKAHGGTVTVANTGEGCCFTLRLPSGSPASASRTEISPIQTVPADTIPAKSHKQAGTP